MTRFIVAEISKNWIDGVERLPRSGLLSDQFERVIAFNAGRGYRLLQFQLHRCMVAPDEMNETIIAVFEADDDEHRALLEMSARSAADIVRRDGDE